MGNILAFFRSLLAWIWTFIISTVCLVMAIGGRHRAWRICGRPWSRGAMWVCGVRLQVQGAERLDRPALLIANHQSFVDPVMLPMVVPRRTKWVAKKEFKKVPILGLAFATAAIYIDRKKPKQALGALEAGIEGLPPGWSVALFPEGTRSPTGELLKFKKGALYMALQTRLPVIPIGISDSHKVLPRNTYWLRSGTIHIAIGEPILTDDWQLENGDQHNEEMHEAVLACMKQAQAMETE